MASAERERERERERVASSRRRVGRLLHSGQLLRKERAHPGSDRHGSPWIAMDRYGSPWIAAGGGDCGDDRHHLVQRWAHPGRGRASGCSSVTFPRSSAASLPFANEFIRTCRLDDGHVESRAPHWAEDGDFAVFALQVVRILHATPPCPGSTAHTAFEQDNITR